MGADSTIEAALLTQRADLLNKLSASAQASEQQRARQVVRYCDRNPPHPEDRAVRLA